MFEATAGLAAGCLILLIISLAMLAQLQRRMGAISRVEAKLDLLLASAGLKYDPLRDASPEITEALRRGEKIQAINLHRAATGVGLKDAKDYVEELQRRAGL